VRDDELTGSGSSVRLPTWHKNCLNTLSNKNKSLQRLHYYF